MNKIFILIAFTMPLASSASAGQGMGYVKAVKIWIKAEGHYQADVYADREFVKQISNSYQHTHDKNESEGGKTYCLYLNREVNHISLTARDRVSLKSMAIMPVESCD